MVSSGAAVNLAAGGQFKASVGGAIDIAGSISASGGAIELSTRRFLFEAKTFGGKPVAMKVPTANGAIIAANVYVEGELDVSGRFVNDIGKFGLDASGSAFLNGGSISIATSNDSLADGGGYRDTTGSILLARGSVLDASSGGYISPYGKAKTATSGVMAGKGGRITLTLYNNDSWSSPTNATTEWSISRPQREQ